MENSTSPTELTCPEDVIGRLREMHAAADAADRPRAALYLGLALADLVPGLPDDDPRRGELAAEGMARLDEAGGLSSAAVPAKERLSRYLPPDSEPAPLRFAGADMTWDVDWPALFGPTEAARNVITMLPALASMLPATSTTESDPAADGCGWRNPAGQPV